MLNTQKQPLVKVFLYLLVISLLVRLPFFFPAVINWDESTFILVGQSIVDGHLLYTDLWDLKSPFTFLFFALCIIIFGKTIVGIRIAGTLCVILVAYFTYLIGESIWSHRVGIISSTLFVVLASTHAYGGSTMSEHIALVPLMGALCLLTRRKLSSHIFFVAGLLVASAVMVRLNLIYILILIGFFSLFNQSKSKKNLNFKYFSTYILGLSFPIISTYIPYYFYNKQQIWWLSVIMGPLKYSKSEGSFLDTLLNQIGNLFTIAWSSPLLCLVLITSSISIYHSRPIIFLKNFTQNDKPLPERRKNLILFGIFFVGVLSSILGSGASYSHYLIQMFPFLVLPAACFFSDLKTRAYWFWAGLITVLLATFTSVIGYFTLAKQIFENRSINYGSAYEVAQFIQKNNPKNEPIYMMTDHIVYWLLNQKPITYPIAHPSNIFSRSYLISMIMGSEIDPDREMKKILDQKPLFIVKKKKVFYLEKKGLDSAKKLLNQALDSRYRLVRVVDDKLIYQKID